MKKVWTNEMVKFLTDNHSHKSIEELTALLNYEFKINLTKASIQSKKMSLNLKSGYKYEAIYTKEVKDFILKNYKGLSNKQLAELVNKKFNLNINNRSITNFKTRLLRDYNINIRTGINEGCYSKGHTPMNKGKKWSEYMSEKGQINSRRTSFKKGHVSANNRPIGSTRVDTDGYTLIKVRDGCLGKNWELKHRVIYEEKYGKIPEGHKLIFADGDKSNFDLENLILTANSEEFIMNQRKLFKKDIEATTVGHTIAKIIDKTNKIRRKRKRGND